MGGDPGTGIKKPPSSDPGTRRGGIAARWAASALRTRHHHSSTCVPSCQGLFRRGRRLLSAARQGRPAAPGALGPQGPPAPRAGHGTRSGPTAPRHPGQAGEHAAGGGTAHGSRPGPGLRRFTKFLFCWWPGPELPGRPVPRKGRSGGPGSATYPQAPGQQNTNFVMPLWGPARAAVGGHPSGCGAAAPQGERSEQGRRRRTGTARRAGPST